MSAGEQRDETRELTVSEAGRRGGEECARRHGRALYERIGKKGGDQTRDRHGSDYYARIGKKGGSTTAQTHGPEFYQEIGKKGGQRVRELIERAKRQEADECS